MNQRALLVLCTTVMFWSLEARAQSQAPVVGHYPQGHTGLRTGDAVEPGFAYGNFSRFHFINNLKDGNGDTIQSLDDFLYANVSAFIWGAPKDQTLLGMNYGALFIVPFNTVSHQPANSPVTTTGFGLGDTYASFLVSKELKDFDMKFAIGVFAPSGSFDPDRSANHGAGFWELMYSAGFAWFPDGNRKSWNLSAMARYEQSFEQEDTGINVGDDIVVDFGVGKMFEVKDTIFNLGVSGFGTWQVQEESGVNAALDTTKYRKYGLGPELNILFPERKIEFIFRYEPQFGAINTTEGSTFWFGFELKF